MMEEKLLPAHLFFLKWFIRIRWIAITILVVSNYAVTHLLGITVKEKQIYLLACILLLLNVFHKITLERIKKDTGTNVIGRVKRNIHFQIISDLIILTVLIHYSGGIENPLFLFYFFHLIIASSIFPVYQSYLYAAFALVLTASLGLFECFGVIPHFPLEGYVSHELYQNVLYVTGTGVVFACTAIMVVSLSQMIIHRSIKSEETYVKTNMELEKKDKLKNEYVFRVTHDIKGHVAAIISCLEILKTEMSGKLNDSQKEFVVRAYERAEFLSEFISDLLNLTRKRLKHDDEIVEFSIPDLIEKVVTPIKILIKDKTINFSYYIDENADRMTGNPYTLEEMYSNLLFNAIKYTPASGRIELNIRRRGDNIISEISDSGIGIPAEDIPKVFDEFFRGSNVPKDFKSGTGLGLAIVQQIVKNHGGKIKVESEEGVWTKFTVSLPVKPEGVEDLQSKLG